MKKLTIFGAALMAGAATPVCAQTMPLGDAAAKFGQRQSIAQVDLSPSGDRAVVLAAGHSSLTQAEVFNLKTGSSIGVLSAGGRADRLEWCRFASEEHLVCRISGVRDYYDVQVEWSRLVTVPAFGGELRELGKQEGSNARGMRLHDGSVIDMLPGENAVLMARTHIAEGRTGSNIQNRASGLSVERVSLENLRAKMIERPREQVGGYLADDRGDIRVRIIPGRDSNGDLTDTVRFDYRVAGKKKWIDLSSATRSGAGGRSGFWPLTIDTATDSVYGLEPLDGREALYRIRLDGSMAKELVASHDRVDINGVVRLGHGQSVIGYSYSEDYDHHVYFDEKYEALGNALSKAMGGEGTVTFRGSSADANKLLLSYASDDDAGRFFLYDQAARQLEPLWETRPQLEGHELANMTPITYQARDGATIPAYVTMPVDHDGPSGAVVLPHGGPSSRDQWGFDWLAQFFASQGYVVIQPQFRGSAGFGSAHEGRLGFNDWRKAMGDIEDSARHLIAEGLVDPDRVAIAGWSYGGYAALLGAAEAPELYKAVVAIAPVTDLDALVRESRKFTDEELVADMIGKDARDNASPRQRAGEINAPVLLAHGSDDVNVSVDQSKRMEDALEDRGKDVKLLTYQRLDHALNDSRARQQILLEAGRLLERTIGG